MHASGVLYPEFVEEISDALQINKSEESTIILGGLHCTPLKRIRVMGESDPPTWCSLRKL